MEKIKNILLLIIPFLTICGSLYHIGYWSTFGLNGLSIVEISDIVKGSALPILIFGGFQLLSVIYPLFVPQSTKEEEKISRQRKITLFLINILAGSASIVLGSYSNDWLVIGLGLSLCITVIIFFTDLLNDYIKSNSARFNFIGAIVTSLVLSFASGKTNSNEIYQNKMFKFTKIRSTTQSNIQNPIDTIKYLGMTSNRYFFTDMKNSRIFIFTKMDTLILESRK